MKNIFLFFLVVVFFCCCKKEEGIHISYKIYTHTENNDTVSVIYIPSAFTPDGDGINDVYFPLLYQCYIKSFDVMNTSGQLIHSDNSLNATWDGKYKGSHAENGIYILKLKAVDGTGYTYEINEEFYLLR